MKKIAQKLYLMDSLGAFLSGMAANGAYLARDGGKAIQSATTFLARGQEASLKSAHNPVVLTQAYSNAEHFGVRCAAEAASFGSAEVTATVIETIKEKICPLAPFC